MALAMRITKAKFEKLSEEFQGEYKVDPADDKHYLLDVTGLDDPAELRRARDREKQRADDAEEALEASEAKVADLEAKRTDKDRDADKIDRQWKRKYDKDTGELNERLTAKDGFISETLIGREADKMSVEISTVPSLMSDHLRKRMRVNFDGDQPTVEFLGKDGKVDTKLDAETLKKEVLATAEYKPILRGSLATGSGASKDGKLAQGGAPATSRHDGSVNVNALDKGAFVERVKARAEARQQ